MSNECIQFNATHTEFRAWILESILYIDNWENVSEISSDKGL